MCGRTNSRSNAGAVRERFELAKGMPLSDFQRGLGRANISPTQGVLAVVQDGDGEPRPEMLRWGLAPRWAKLKGGPSLFQARNDKLASSNAWKPLARTASQRCLMVADGWIEWQRPEDPKQTKQPFLHRLKDGELFAMAGLWTVAQPQDATSPSRCAVVTTSANRDVRFVNHRMPVELDGPAAEHAWLDPDVDLEAAVQLAAPLPDGRLDVHPISPRVTAAATKDSTCSSVSNPRRQRASGPR